MKRLFQVILAVAMVLSFMPKADAQDSTAYGTTLGVTVIFEVPLTIETSASGQIYVVVADEPISFEVYATGDRTRDIVLEMVEGPEGAYFELDPLAISDGTVVGRFHWTATPAQVQDVLYNALFQACYADSVSNADGAVQVAVELKVVYPPKIDAFANALQIDPLDIAGLDPTDPASEIHFGADGRIDQKDLTAAEEGYHLVIRFLDKIPNELRLVFDRDQDGDVDLDDLANVHGNMEEAIADIEAIQGLVATLAGGSLDLNGDGIIDEADAEHATWAYTRAFDLLGYLDQMTINGLDQNDDGAVNSLDLDIVIEMILNGIPRIAIELLPTTWDLRGIKLGDDVYNTDDGTRYGTPLHTLRNIGNVDVDVVMTYADWYGVPPAYDTLDDHFQTSVALVSGHLITIQPPDSPYPPAVIRQGFMAGTDSPMCMHYHAPVSLSNPVEEMGATYDIRAYKAVE
jgi:hypothetical protein